jgi:hypothetical protein
MKFEVGDRVRVIRDASGYYQDAIGKTAIIIEERYTGSYVLKFDDYRTQNGEDELIWEDHEIEDIHYEEAKAEVLSIVDYALKDLEKDSVDDRFACANGSIWTYNGVRDFLKKYLK